MLGKILEEFEQVTKAKLWNPRRYPNQQFFEQLRRTSLCLNEAMEYFDQKVRCEFI